MTLTTQETWLASQDVDDIQYCQHSFLERSELEDSQIWHHAILDITANNTPLGCASLRFYL